jgi:hypothetical protein
MESVDLQLHIMSLFWWPLCQHKYVKQSSQQKTSHTSCRLTDLLRINSMYHGTWKVVKQSWGWVEIVTTLCSIDLCWNLQTECSNWFSTVNQVNAGTISPSRWMLSFIPFPRRLGHILRPNIIVWERCVRMQTALFALWQWTRCMRQRNYVISD